MILVAGCKWIQEVKNADWDEKFHEQITNFILTSRKGFSLPDNIAKITNFV